MITIVDKPKSPESVFIDDIPEGTVFWGRFDGDELELYLRTDEDKWPLVMLSNSPGLLVADVKTTISDYTPVNIEIKVVP